MESAIWVDQKIKLDIWSIMMYPWDGFITGQALDQGLSTMNDVKTGAPVQKPRNLSLGFAIFLRLLNLKIVP